MNWAETTKKDQNYTNEGFQGNTCKKANNLIFTNTHHIQKNSAGLGSMYCVSSVTGFDEPKTAATIFKV